MLDFCNHTMLKIAFNYTLRNIARTPVRSFFTIFSISMIISMYTLLTVIASSFTSQLTGILKSGDIDIIIQSKFSATPLSSSIPQEVIEKILNSSDISSSISVVMGKKRLKDGHITFLFGMSDFRSIAGKLGLSLKDGLLYQKSKHQIIMAEKLMKNKSLKLGDTIKLSQAQPYKIVGNYNSWISFFNASMISDLQTAREILHKPKKTNILFAVLKNPSKRDEVIQMINKNYPSVYAVKSSDFSNTLGALKNMFYLSDIISIITLIIACAILINTFLMAIFERTKEIGILNAIGWTKGMIVLIFIVESLFLALLGGILGFIFSWAMLVYIQKTFQNISFYLPQSLDFSVFGYSILMCVVIAIISAIFPALYASKISIAKALQDG